MDIKEFYELQESIGATKYKGNNLKCIMELINKKELKAPVTTFNYWNKLGYKVVDKSKYSISYINKKYKEENKEKVYFRKKAIFGSNQVVKRDIE